MAEEKERDDEELEVGGGDGDGDDEEVAVSDEPPADVSRDLFLVWRTPRLGLRNPQRMTNPVWTWLARSKEMSAWSANERFEGPSSLAVGPGWCMNRFGQTETALPDGRVVAIGGEHEDYYDPDFYIYNDVIVRGADGTVEIYGYPPDVLPPTDNHAAVLDGGRILVIGNLGYTWQRRVGTTTVFAVDTKTFEVSRVPTSGDAPGWIFRHSAELVDGCVVVRGGERAVLRDGLEEIVENIDDWSLEVASGVWTRLTDRRWPLWQLARADGERNELFWIHSGTYYFDGDSDFAREQMAELEQRLGWRPDFAVHAARYAPPVAHTQLPEDEERWNFTRVSVDGVTVRYVEESHDVRVTIEGELPEATIAAIVEDARGKLEALERTPYVARRLER